MKRILYFLMIALLANTFIHGQSLKNVKAISEVENRLNTIKDWVTDVDDDSTLRRCEAVVFLERLTKLYSESDANDIGKLNPTKKDYDMWNNWYQLNKLKLYWNKRKQKVLVKK